MSWESLKDFFTPGAFKIRTADAEIDSGELISRNLKVVSESHEKIATLFMVTGILGAAFIGLVGKDFQFDTTTGVILGLVFLIELGELISTEVTAHIANRLFFADLK